MAAALGVITAIFMTGRQQQLLLPLVIVFIAFFSASQGTIWVYQSEIFPKSVRNSSQSFASFWLLVARRSYCRRIPYNGSSVQRFFLSLLLYRNDRPVLCRPRIFPETKGRSLGAIPTANT
jgi:Sugar (and other) transporter